MSTQTPFCRVCCQVGQPTADGVICHRCGSCSWLLIPLQWDVFITAVELGYNGDIVKHMERITERTAKRHPEWLREQ